MNTLHAGLMCTLLLTGAIAGLFGCMSAVRCHRRFVFAICLAITLLDFVPLAVLLSHLLTGETHSPILWTVALLLTVLSLFASFMLWHKGKQQLSPVSIKESCDHLPSALCFAWENGQPCLKNLKMDELSHLLTGNGESGLDAAERIKRAFPQIRIIIVTSMPECSYLSRAREIGVESFWYKEEGRESLLDVMERTMAGESIYPDAPPELQLGLASSYEFTGRELEVLREMTGGDTNQEIAERLHMSVATVKTHILNMLEKTGFRNRTELAVRARESGLVILNRKSESHWKE